MYKIPFFMDAELEQMHAASLDQQQQQLKQEQLKQEQAKQEQPPPSEPVKV